jgi:hypothetical protein
MECKHPEKGFVITVGRDGRKQWEERCHVCRANVRGGWVKRADVAAAGVDPDSCPVARDLRSPEDKGEQSSLFGGRP